METQGHKIKPENLKALLDDMSEDFKSKLSARGKRKGGTHACWKDGDSKDGWHQPFSMASTPKVSSKGYPVKKFDERVAQWIKRISTAISGT